MFLVCQNVDEIPYCSTLNIEQNWSIIKWADVWNPTGCTLLCIVWHSNMREGWRRRPVSDSSFKPTAANSLRALEFIVPFLLHPTARQDKACRLIWWVDIRYQQSVNNNFRFFLEFEKLRVMSLDSCVSIHIYTLIQGLHNTWFIYRLAVRRTDGRTNSHHQRD